MAEATGLARRRAIRELLMLAVWMAVWLIVIDQTVNVGLKLTIIPPKIRSFFTYGHSIRWKLQDSLGRPGETPTVYASNGWLEPPQPAVVVRQPASDLDPTVTIYGNSFSDRLAYAMVRIEPRVTVRKIIAINAPPNHSYASFRRDTERTKSKVVVLGVLAANVGGVMSRGYTWAFDSPPAYTQPLMKLREGQLDEEWPRILSLEECRKCLFDDKEWKRFSDEIAPSDPFFDPFLFNRGVADDSVIGCLLRKAWGQNRRQQVLGRFQQPGGFIRESEAIRVLSRMLVKFGAEARAEGILPVVVLLEASGMEHYLKIALGDELTSARVPFISTSDLFRTNDRHNYIPDGHYTPESDEKIAKAVLDLMRGAQK